MMKSTFLGTEETASIFEVSKANRTDNVIPKLVGGSYSCFHSLVIPGRVEFMLSDFFYQSKLSNAVQRLLIRKARTGKFTARKLYDEYAPFLTVREVQHLLQNSPDLRWARSIGIQPLSRNHRRHPQNWCRNNLK